MYSIAVLKTTSPNQWAADEATWEPIAKDRLRCLLCPRLCTLSEGQRGFCEVRERAGDHIRLNANAAPSGFCIDPIEKKPLHHFYPGTPVLSFGGTGCNLACRFCQNWQISKEPRSGSFTAPENIVRAAVRHKCRSIAYTYNDPVISWEYVREVAEAAHNNNVANVAVTAGYLSKPFREPFFAYMDAANIDLKSFSETTYHRICGAHLAPILETLQFVAHHTDCWLEVTTLLIPGLNDTESELRSLCEWVSGNLGSHVPLHLSAFHPDYRMRDRPPTSPQALRAARKIALQSGLKFVYTGNVHDRDGDATFCASCGHRLIQRDWYELQQWDLVEGACPKCGTVLPGRFDNEPGTFGAQRIPHVRT